MVMTNFSFFVAFCFSFCRFSLKHCPALTLHYLYIPCHYYFVLLLAHGLSWFHSNATTIFGWIGYIKKPVDLVWSGLVFG